ncbi:MAG: IPTL-CTERM sorting domain-containing protein [Thermodesulfobacteriota bacterium]
MKGFILFTILSVLFVSDYAFAQVCPCDTLETPNGTTGNDIVELLCPGGELAEGAISEINQDAVIIQSISENAAYLVQVIPGATGCAIFAGGGGDGTETTLEEALVCRERLIERCDLARISPIPTLSEWGMIAMAGVLGAIGLYAAMRRRKAAA